MKTSIAVLASLDACLAPFAAIMTNAGLNPGVIERLVLDTGDSRFGYDAAKDTVGDMFELGVIDPAKVTVSALQNAASVAGLLLTTACMITDIVE